MRLIVATSTGARDEDLKKIVSEGLRDAIAKHADVAKKYRVLILHDEGVLVRGDADSVYGAVKRLTDDTKPLLLVLHSFGGEIAPAFKIGRLCQNRRGPRFIVVVPRMAKSAATLVCCAADEIHTGQMTEFGPIDPQIDRMPALAIKHSVEHLAELTKDYPSASEMFASYLAKTLPVARLGYYERIALSGMDYAERLLSGRIHDRSSPQLPAAKATARRLVYDYKDHGFVIESGEAMELFGASVVRVESPEYSLGDAIYEWLSLASMFVANDRRQMYFIGSAEDVPQFLERPA